MPHIAVAMHTRLRRFGGSAGKHRVHKILVTIDTSALSHAMIARLDLDRVVVISQREGQRMEEAIVGFGDPFADRIMRQMTVIANCYMVVTGMLPRIEMLLHHVTVDAGLWIIA